MEEKIEERTAKIQEFIKQIGIKENEIGQLKQECLMIQGEIRLLRELESEKESEKDTEE